MRPIARLLALSAASVADPVIAQRADDNAVTAAEDAFGTSIGNETIGLYSSSQVRGFSPVSAGNVRIEGVYFDRQASLSERLVSGSTIRVGLSAQGYPFPAPTGIVDYKLRSVRDRPIISLVVGSFEYGAPTIEVDAQIPIDGERLGIAAGASYAHEKYYDGSDAHYIRAAIIPHWRPSDGIELAPFWSMTIGKDEQVAPTIVTAGSFVAPEAPRRRYFGQEWAAKDSRGINAGVIAKARIGRDWFVVVGAVRSIFVNEQNFAELFVDTTQDGQTRERIIADPGQRYASTSGELRVSRSFFDGPRLHTLHASVRARRLDSFYGGAAEPIDLGQRRLGMPVPVAQPASYSFGERVHDSVRQTTIGLAYEGRWKDVGELSLGVQRASYSKTIDLPGDAQTTRTHDKPWLLSASAAAYLTDTLALYAGYTRGLEESGLAPNNAANRNEALPAIRTRQADAGIRWAISPRMKLVAGVFDVRKPYFNTDEANVFTILGDVRHRGVELSLSGNPTDQLSVVAGAVLMQPRVTGEAVELGRVGRKPLGQSATILRGNADYRLPFLPGVSLDLALSWYGKRPASRDNLVSVDPYALIDIGARYRFKLGRSPATFRIQMQNVTNTFAWNIVGSNSYGLMDKRRFTAFLAVDL
ncbi:TonB-dependent receptor [Sphingobium sp. BYY-5]|uniref:TonB-dependent siderophore receptor n=1 Tax=Sphingobium sp. BYY-5 TaxID=2926400 RepID=UPI001FA71AFA|nr:TonB-dependent receptor [Sphingobium sp. BYY-5]MCI4591076.1 TonB-dependent receptor [Sphingobium sp. BYY-5]